MNLLVFGLSITSSWGNGHATVYRGLAKALNRVGVRVVFVEKDVPWYASNRDLWSCDFAEIRLYRETEQLDAVIAEEIGSADVVLVGSYFPDAIPLIDRLRARGGPLRIFYDIDTPITLARLASQGATEYVQAEQIPSFDCVLSFTGGPALKEITGRWGARGAVAFYCAFDPETHHRVEADERFECGLGYMGTYSADRQPALEKLFVEPARRLPDHRFILAGPQYPAMDLPANVTHYQHVSPPDHPAFYSSCRLSLNITRAPMAEWGYSPSVRLFEAAGCGACTVSDRWPGMEEVFEVGREVLVAADGAEIAGLMRRVGPDESRMIGGRARERALRDHTYDVRAQQFLELVRGL